MPIASLDEIRARVGQTIGVSDWIMVDQNRIDAFADATEDRQFIHVDPATAAQTPFGGTIAHGFLSLSLLSRMAADVPSSIDCELVYDHRTNEADTSARTKSELLIELARLFAARGVEFAYPPHTTFTAAHDGTLVMPYAGPAAPK